MQLRSLLGVLALAALLTLAGCGGPAGTLEMDPVDDEELADHASKSVVDDLPPDAQERQVIRRAIENGPTNVTKDRPPVPGDYSYEYRGDYYDISYEVVGTEPGVETDLEVDYNATDPEGARLAFEDLPGVDREKIEGILDYDPLNLKPGTDLGQRVTYGESAAQESELLSHAGESVVITYEGSEYAVDVGERSENTFEVYRYEATLVAESSEAYGEQLGSQYEFTLSGLDDDERSVVEEALDGSYHADDTDDTGFDKLADRFRDYEAVRSTDYRGSWVVRYDGQLYWVEMRYGEFVDD